MEEKPKRACSCRLAVNSETGRVQWCIGQQKIWPNILKRLVFVPIVLLTVALIVYFVSRVGVSATVILQENTINFKEYEGLELLEEEQKREVLFGLKTVYIPDFELLNNSFQYTLQRTKRDLLEDLLDSETPVHDENLSDRLHTILEDKLIVDEEEHDDDELNAKVNQASFRDEARDLKRRKRLTDIDLSNYETTKYYGLLSTDSDDELISFNTSSKEDFLDTTKYEKPDFKPLFFKLKRTKKEIRELQSNLMKKYMNTEANPCEDFYDYACGNWEQYFEIPPDKAAYDTFEIVRENLDFVIKEILNEVQPVALSKQIDEAFKNGFVARSIFQDNMQYDPSSAVDKVKNFFISCMDEEVIGKRSEEPLRRIIRQLGGWPMVDMDWNESKFDLIWLLGKLRLLNNDVLISEWIGPDMKNSNEYIIHIDQTSLGLPSRDYYIDSTNVRYIEGYKQFIKDIALLMGADPSNVDLDINALVHFETQLAQSMSSNEDRRNISDIYLRTDLQTLPLYFPEFKWDKYFRIVLGKEISPLFPVAVYCSEYLQKLLYILQDTPPRILQNYVLWRFIRHRTSNLDQRFTSAKQRFYLVLFGREKEPPRWTFCVSQVNANMGMAIGALFVKRYFDKSSRNDTILMTEQLEEAFRNTLMESNWLDNDTKEYAKIKINQMDLKIGFPDFILDDKELARRYEDIYIHPGYFFENTLNILRHLTRAEKRRIGNFVNRTHWSTSPAVVNAYYSRNKNQILFPAGMLQPPFYHRHFPKALNFGGIGVVIGHEITHGFDDKGRLFDHQGNLHLWWKEKSIEKFYEKAQCLINQYSRYVLPEIKLNLDGYLTQGENIADNGGLKQAFRAYKEWLEKNPASDETLPDFNLTGEQLFFLNFAQVWCGKQRIEAARSRIKTSVHAPGMFRVIGAISNSEDFARTFNCPLNSPMNPKIKCTIW